jgi:hypothetical protein
VSWQHALSTERRSPPSASASSTLVASRYGESALGSELERLLRAPIGSRNEQLNRSAFKLGQLVGTGELSKAATEQALIAYAALIGLPASESESTVVRAVRDGARHPRTISHTRVTQECS